jgi:hypothetical protein
MIEKYEVYNRWTNAVQFTAEITVTPDMRPNIKLGLAVKWAKANNANLSGADLSDANLSDANLSGANLSGADLSDANLSGADLSDVNLSGANLRGADLSDANLSDANLRGACLSYTNLSGAKNADYAIAKTRILPEGALIGWKKCAGDVIVKLRIPEDSPRSRAFGRKCRAKFADVLEIIGADEAKSSRDLKFIYRTGERVEAMNWSDNWQDECAGGVHFFITKIEAENY